MYLKRDMDILVSLLQYIILSQIGDLCIIYSQKAGLVYIN